MPDGRWWMSWPRSRRASARCKLVPYVGPTYRMERRFAEELSAKRACTGSQQLSGSSFKKGTKTGTMKTDLFRSEHRPGVRAKGAARGDVDHERGQIVLTGQAQMST